MVRSNIIFMIEMYESSSQLPFYICSLNTEKWDIKVCVGLIQYLHIEYHAKLPPIHDWSSQKLVEGTA